VVSAQVNLDTSQSLTDSDTLVSSNAVFMLGFFSPATSTNRYVGVWYTQGGSDGEQEVVWVANRDNPLTDSSGVFKISEDGNLRVLNGENTSFWSSNVSSSDARNLVVHFMDTGNLILLSNDSGQVIWQSFDHPTDVFLPEMTFSIDGTVNERQVLFRSWKSPVDPSGGNFTVGIDTRNPPQVFLWDDDRPYWRNGPWNGNLFVGVQSGLSITTDNAGEVYFGFTLANQSAQLLQLVHFVVNYNGSLVQRDWDNGSRKWETGWNSQQSECDIYDKCGPFGSCNATNSPICGCLKGFVPKNSTEWNKGNWSGGCVRKTLLQCDTVGVKADGFWKMENVKVPDNPQWVSAASEGECNSQCIGDCSCLAFGYYPSIGCMTWNDSLIDIEEYSESRGIDLSIRLASSDLGTRITQQGNIMVKGDKTDIQIGDLPMFELEKLVTATNDFHESNKLGRGGFGTVYKGKLDDGEDIAVKRLSKLSGQGLEEFMTEVLVISKLQHRNLVRLLGCCVEGEEKLLVYEYMPNKSLDALLFDRRYQELLGWKTRFNIIQGISRGLLYLHRDSRLKIIHRDLKASNILLDDKLNSKISDFGMAKIFGGSEDQADTNRVVGTYGYMSPEYAMEGRFSEKSDIYSFGVVLLEIVSGRRNNSFRDEESLSLLGHAWKLWNEDNILSLIDPFVLESGFQDEILRCIQVALLCVQELPEDRPNISMVISMIDSEVLNLPHPKQPGFTQRRYTDNNQSENGTSSVNRVSLSYITGRKSSFDFKSQWTDDMAEFRAPDRAAIGEVHSKAGNKEKPDASLLRKVEEWRQGNWTCKCARIAELHCDSTETKEDVFLRLEHMKVPDYSDWISGNDQEDCGNTCLGDCSYYSGIGCMIWNRCLIDIQRFSGDGAHLFIRLAHSELSGKAISGILLFMLRNLSTVPGLKSTGREEPNSWHDNMKIAAEGRNVEFADLPMFNLERLITATSDFSDKWLEGATSDVVGLALCIR
ncbi:hypothetical protein KSS87_019532, partial [Heliosperma pusillum]